MEAGGVEQVIRETAPVLRQMGCELDLAAPRGVWTDEVAPLFDSWVELPRYSRSSSHQIRVKKILASQLPMLRPAIVHAHSALYGLAAARAAALCAAGCANQPRVVVSIHKGYRKLNRFPGIGLLIRWVCSQLNERVDALLPVSEEIAATLRQSGINRIAMKVVHNGIRFTQPKPDARIRIRGELNASCDDVVIFSAGRLAPQKDYGTLLKCAHIVRQSNSNLHFWIAGVGPQRRSLERQVDRLGMQNFVKFLGYRRDIRDILEASDLFALSSIWEGISISLLEAMAAEKCCVVTRVGGNPEVITDSVDGCLVDCRQPEKMAEIFLELSRNSGMRSRMGKQARETVEKRFSWTATAAAYLDTYHEILTNRASIAEGLR